MTSPTNSARLTQIRAIAAIAAGFLLSLSCQQAAPRAQATPVFVGVLRADGLLVPIAINDGAEWWNPWPFSHSSDETITRLALPTSLEGIPADWLPPGVRLPLEWRVQLVGSGSATIHLGRPALPPHGFRMSALIGVSTDYRVVLRTDGYLDGDDQELGIAVAGAGVLGRFTPVDDTQAKALLRVLAADLQRAETAEIADRIKERQSQPDWNGRPVTFPATEQQRKEVPMSSFGFLRADRSSEGRTLFYFTAQKDYGRKPYPECDATVDFSGIVVQEANGSIHPHSLSAYTLLECSRDNAINASFDPLASLSWNGKTVWVIRDDAEDGYGYGLVDPLAAEIWVPLKGLWGLRAR